MTFMEHQRRYFDIFIYFIIYLREISQLCLMLFVTPVDCHCMDKNKFSTFFKKSFGLE